MDQSAAPLLAPEATAPLVFETTAERFRADVVEASREALVLVDFWAEWCGPCKTLGPLLEKLVQGYGGRVRLAKVDVDKNQMLAAQFRIQTVPMVYAFLNGQPVDGFAGALPEGQLRAFIDRLVAQVANPLDAEVAPMLEAAAEAVTAGDWETAGALYQQALSLEPENPAALGGLARALVQLGHTAEAAELLAQVPQALAADPHIAQARAALDLAGQAAPAEGLDALAAEVDADPADHAKRLELASALFAAGNAEGAVDHLLESIRRDRAWNDGAARQQLLKMFEAIGLEDPFTMAARRRLSAILFS